MRLYRCSRPANQPASGVISDSSNRTSATRKEEEAHWRKLLENANDPARTEAANEGGEAPSVGTEVARGGTEIASAGMEIVRGGAEIAGGATEAVTGGMAEHEGGYPMYSVVAYWDENGNWRNFGWA